MPFLGSCVPSDAPQPSGRHLPRAKIRVIVRRILDKHGYPPNLREEATKLVLEQARMLCADWATCIPTYTASGWEIHAPVHVVHVK